jgi:hypothetical protein
MLRMLFDNTSYNVSFLSGSMPMEDRQKTVDDFNSDPGQFVFLISTKAGGKCFENVIDSWLTFGRCRTEYHQREQSRDL